MQRGSDIAPGLLGRDRELASLSAAVDRLRADTGIVVAIEGAAGTGKSCLADALVAQLRARDIAVRHTVAVELDRDLQLAVARRLLGGVDPASPGREWSAQMAEGGLGAIHRLVARATEDAAGGRLVLCVDDLQWADEQSLQTIEALCGLTRELAFGVVVTWRRGELAAQRRHRLLALDGVSHLELRDLGSADAEAFVRRRLPAADAAFASACAQVSGGNPFLLHELVVAVRDGEMPHDAAAAERILEFEPAAVRGAVLTRLGQMPPAPAALARSAAILGDATPLHHVARLSELDADTAARAADTLVEVEILTVDGDGALSFRHPLLGSVVRADIGAFQRSQLYRRAARVVAADGLAQRAGALLLRALPAGDPDAVQLLRTAAARAARSGDAATAVRLLKRGLAEPPTADLRRTLLVEVARAQAALGDVEALEYLDEALEQISDPRARARILNEIARLHHVRGDFPRAARLADRALEELAEGNPGRERVQATWLMAAGLDPDRSAETVELKRRIAESAVAGAPPTDPELKASISLHLICMFGTPAIVAETARAAVRGYAYESDDGLGLGLGFSLSALFFTGRLAELVEMCDLALAVAAERSSILAASAAAQWRAHARIEMGDCRGALDDAQTALLPYRYGWTAPASNAGGIRALALLELGDVDGARAALTRDRPLPYPAYFHVLGVVELAAQNPAAAHAAFTEAGRMLSAIWEVDSPAVVPWRSGAAMAARALGDRDAALELSEAELVLARRTGVPVALGRALRAQGIAVGGDDGIGLLRDACATLAGCDSATEHLRAQVDLGAALRRAGDRRESREVLSRARDAATRLALGALAGRATSEHEASGGRPRRVQAEGAAGLTASERRIALLAAAGRTNREIAGELFLAPKTVEWHLRQVFRKLGITTRRALAVALSAEDR